MATATESRFACLWCGLGCASSGSVYRHIAEHPSRPPASTDPAAEGRDEAADPRLHRALPSRARVSADGARDRRGGGSRVARGGVVSVEVV